MTREQHRQFILSDEPSYQAAVTWMETQAFLENKLTYMEDDLTYHKNAEELIRDGYLDRYLDTHPTP
jgi:hypothetical protein